MKTIIAIAIAATTIVAATAADARPHHRHQVCSIHHHHRVCHWVG